MIGLIFHRKKLCLLTAIETRIVAIHKMIEMNERMTEIFETPGQDGFVNVMSLFKEP